MPQIIAICAGDDDTLCEVIREALRGFLVTVLPLLTYPDSWNSERGEHDEDRDDFLTLRDARLGIQVILELLGRSIVSLYISFNFTK